MLCSVCYQAKRKEGFTLCKWCLYIFNREAPAPSIKRAVEWAANRARDFALAKRLRKKSGTDCLERYQGIVAESRKSGKAKR